VIKSTLLVIFFFFTGICAGIGQTISMKGRVTDDTLARSVTNVVAMAVRLSDSVMVKFARTDSNGFFRMQGLPVDTYQVVFSHQKFADRTFIIMGNKNDSVIDFKNVSLPIKSAQLAEVVIYGFSSPVYFKGDTLIYTADSFNVKPNAVVEDLLKKLPGIRVDGNGKIFSQGQVVDKVLVDGDEFFGSDPTVATKNLPANSLESVQVYDKKKENASEDSKETEKIMNLKLKEDAKKGYFGKISGAGDFDKFYEEQVLLNRFNGRQKISIFSLGSNTLNSSFGWQDRNEYGLDNEDDWQYSEENDSWTSSNNYNSSGIPQTIKNGIYFTDYLFKDTKVSLNYTNTNTNILTKREMSSKYLFSDTSYQTNRITAEEKSQQGNAVNIFVEQKIDSLTRITLSSNIKFDTGKRNYNENNQFISSENVLQRETDIDNNNELKKQSIKNEFTLFRDFKKKNRELFVNYHYNINSSNSNGILNSVSTDSIQSSGEINQQKSSETDNSEHTAFIVYTEPLSKKVKASVGYFYVNDKRTQDKKTFDFFSGSYEQLNDSLTNSFENNLQISRLGFRLTHEVKKRNLYIGARFRQAISEGVNKETQQVFSNTVNAILPYAGYRYSFSDNERFSFSYLSSSKQPELSQLQPLSDNSDPNFIYIGNPDLLPSLTHNLKMEYNFYKPVSGNYMWTSLRFATINNSISNSVSYDTSGRSITQPVNINGNYNGNFNLNYTFSLFSRKLQLGPNINSSYSNYSNIINGQTNSTRSLSLDGGFYATIHADSTVEINLNGSYGNTISKTSINDLSNRKFTTANYGVSVVYDITKKWVLSSNFSYTYQNQQANAKSIEYYIWEASLSKKFLKKENLVISIDAFDLLNQNINVEQSVADNVITYSKSNTIGRYVLLKAVYRFTANKASAK